VLGQQTVNSKHCWQTKKIAQRAFKPGWRPFKAPKAKRHCLSLGAAQHEMPLAFKPTGFET